MTTSRDGGCGISSGTWGWAHRPETGVYSAPNCTIHLRVADNVIAEAKLERIERVGETVVEYGTYPILPTRLEREVE